MNYLHHVQWLSTECLQYPTGNFLYFPTWGLNGNYLGFLWYFFGEFPKLGKCQAVVALRPQCIMRKCKFRSVVLQASKRKVVYAVCRYISYQGARTEFVIQHFSQNNGNKYFFVVCERSHYEDEYKRLCWPGLCGRCVLLAPQSASCKLQRIWQ